MSNDKPRMNDSIRLVLFSIALLAFGCTRAPERDPNVFTFTFAPPDGTRFVETITSTRKLLGNGRLRRTDLGQTQAETVLERRGDEGFVITSKLLSTELIRDGSVVRDPVSQALVDAVITARLDLSGQIVAWSGFEEVAESLFARIAKALGEVVAAVGAPDVDLSAGEAHIRGTISRVVDPATLLSYAETITRRVDAVLDLGGDAGPEPLTIDEKRQYDFRYLAE